MPLQKGNKTITIRENNFQYKRTITYNHKKRPNQMDPQIVEINKVYYIKTSITKRDNKLVEDKAPKGKKK